MDDHLSRLQKLRQKYLPHLPKILQNLHQINFEKLEATSAIKDPLEIKKLFPQTFGRPVLRGKEGDVRKSKAHRIGVVFSGGQAAGGHNVISGLFDALRSLCPTTILFGFLGGPIGILEEKAIQITSEALNPYRNQGGFDLIGSGRTKIESEEQLQAALNTVQKMSLDGLVIIGGDDSNTNAAILAEYFINKGCNTTVVGVPKTIDGDLKNSYVPISFGFDTACKTYSELIGNIARDALSAKKYYHFIKLMGRSASHITLECALCTHPNITLIAEEVAEKKMTLTDVTNQICDVISKRAEKGRNYGIVLIPEGLIEFIPEIGKLIEELNVLTGQNPTLQIDAVASQLSAQSKKCFQLLPQDIQKQLLLERDPHGNVQVSLIETEKLLMNTVSVELENRKKQGTFRGKFAAQNHFMGYEGRAGFPSNFDAHYCYALGYVAALLVDEAMTGYMACVMDLHRPDTEWKIAGLPLTMLMNMEMRKGKAKPVIQKTLVDLKGKAFLHFQQQRTYWAEEDSYRFPGPIQFFGDVELIEAIPMTMFYESL